MTQITRRDFLPLAAVSALGVQSAIAETAQPTTSLGEIAKANNIVFGSAFDIQIIDNPAFRSLTLKQAGILTTDTSMKIWAIHPEENVTHYENADRLVQFANNAKIPIRGNTLIWNEWNPPWVAKLSKARRIYWMERFIEETMGRYEGRMQSWDVVNEPFFSAHGKPGGFRNGPWYQAMGKDYIIKSYIIANRCDPKAKLVLNESGAEWAYAYCPTDDDRKGTLRLIDEIRDAGGRIDVIGLQCHWMASVKFDPHLLSDFLGQLAEKRVEVYITEMDVDDSAFPDDIDQRDRLVAQRYSQLLNVMLKSPIVTKVITWELEDQESWIYKAYKPLPNSARRPRPLPFDRHLRPKPAYYAIARAFDR